MAKIDRSPVYQLKVTLQRIKPEIWRRLLVSSSVSLKQLHDILQIAFDWTDSHLHQFEVGDAIYSLPDPDFEHDVVDERRVTLRRVLPAARSSMTYLYDFGDSWVHRIVLERVLDLPVPLQVPSCVAGARARPPEDCGGVPGYANVLRVIADPTDEEHESMFDWVGEDYDPERFDIDRVNSQLMPRRRRKSPG